MCFFFKNLFFYVLIIMVYCCIVFIGLLVWFFFMFLWCEVLRNNINRYDYFYGMFKFNSLIKWRDDIICLKSVVRVFLWFLIIVSVFNFGVKGDGKIDDM